MTDLAQFFQRVPAKEFWKSVENWQSYRSSLVQYFLGHTACILLIIVFLMFSSLGLITTAVRLKRNMHVGPVPVLVLKVISQC